MASSLAKKVGDALTVGSYRACSNGRSREDEYSNSKPLTEGRVSSKEPIHHKCGQKGK